MSSDLCRYKKLPSINKTTSVCNGRDKVSYSRHPEGRGALIVSTLNLPDGKRVLIDLGWVPQTLQENKNILASRLSELEGAQFLGILSKGDSSPYSATQISLSVEELAKMLNVEESRFLFRRFALESEPGRFPRPLREDELCSWYVMPSRHLAYATFWLTLTCMIVSSE